jgi:nucleoside-diphosphate-sugar epimerase
MRALVTGGTGFIGNRLILYLARNGWDVTCLVRRNLTTLVEHVTCTGIVPANIDCVFHLAATIATPDWTASQFLSANAGFTVEMLELAEACRARSFVYTSTQLVIGKPERTPFSTDHPTRPESPYAVSKLAGEMACEYFRRSGRVAATSLRLTSVVGAGMAAGGVLPLFVERAFCSEDLTFHGAGARVQNFVHVDDVVCACVLAAQRPGSGVLNVGGSDSLSMRELAELVVRSTPGSGSRVVASGSFDPQEDYRWVPDIDSARDAIGYSPCMRLATFLPEYVAAIAHPQPVERWWEDA